MEQKQYIISDASKLVDVEQHTLRYWQDELKLDITRNALGHRMYSEEDICTFKKIKALKDKGFQLKAIKMVLPDLGKIETLDPASLLKLKEATNQEEVQGEEPMEEAKSIVTTESKEDTTQLTNASENKMGQFRTIMKSIMADALRENNVELSDTVSMNVTNSVIKEMDYLLRMKEEREEERYKQFDRLLREYQSGKQHSAAAKEKEKRKISRLFGRKTQ